MSMPAWRMVTPRSLAASIHGATLASWSRPVTRISSPGPSPRQRIREACIVRVVMLAPKTISEPDAAPRNAAASDRASSRIRSLALEVTNGPPRLAFESR